MCTIIDKDITILPLDATYPCWRDAGQYIRSVCGHQLRCVHATEGCGHSQGEQGRYLFSQGLPIPCHPLHGHGRERASVVSQECLFCPNAWGREEEKEELEEEEELEGHISDDVMSDTTKPP